MFRSLGGHQLTGTIPSSIGNLAQLQVLYVHSCFQFHPPIQIKTNTNCSIFCMFRDLSANQLSGTIPSSIGNLTKVQSLYVPSCIQFHQQTHINLTLSTICMFRYLFNNSFSGVIPQALCQHSYEFGIEIFPNNGVFTCPLPTCCVFSSCGSNASCSSPITAVGEVTALNDMQSEWGTELGWVGSPNCNWRGIICDSTEHVISLYVIFLVVFFFLRWTWINIGFSYSITPSSLWMWLGSEILPSINWLARSLHRLTILYSFRTCSFLFYLSMLPIHQNLLLLSKLFFFVVILNRFLNWNQLSGTIPSTIGNLAQLRRLYADYFFQLLQYTHLKTNSFNPILFH